MAIRRRRCARRKRHNSKKTITRKRIQWNFLSYVWQERAGQFYVNWPVLYHTQFLYIIPHSFCNHSIHSFRIFCTQYFCSSIQDTARALTPMSPYHSYTSGFRALNNGSSFLIFSTYVRSISVTAYPSFSSICAKISPHGETTRLCPQA